MAAVGGALKLMAKESERMLRPASRIRASVLILPPQVPTPSIAAFGLLNREQVAYQLPSVTKQDSGSKESPEVRFGFPSSPSRGG